MISPVQKPECLIARLIVVRSIEVVQQFTFKFPRDSIEVCLIEDAHHVPYLNTSVSIAILIVVCSVEWVRYFETIKFVRSNWTFVQWNGSQTDLFFSRLDF